MNQRITKTEAFLLGGFGLQFLWLAGILLYALVKLTLLSTSQVESVSISPFFLGPDVGLLGVLFIVGGGLGLALRRRGARNQAASAGIPPGRTPVLIVRLIGLGLLGFGVANVLKQPVALLTPGLGPQPARAMMGLDGGEFTRLSVFIALVHITLVLGAAFTLVAAQVVRVLTFDCREARRPDAG